MEEGKYDELMDLEREIINLKNKRNKLHTEYIDSFVTESEKEELIPYGEISKKELDLTYHNMAWEEFNEYFNSIDPKWRQPVLINKNRLTEDMYINAKEKALQILDDVELYESKRLFEYVTSK